MKRIFLVIAVFLSYQPVSHAEGDDNSDLRAASAHKYKSDIKRIELKPGGSIRAWLEVDDKFNRTEIVCAGHATKLACEIYTAQKPEYTIKGVANGSSTIVGLKVGGNPVHSEYMSPEGVKKVQAKLEEYRATGICLPEESQPAMER